MAGQALTQLLLVLIFMGLQHGESIASNQSMRERAGPGTDKVIVHLLEWSWRDVARECSDLAKWGYWGVQVSPVQEDIIGNEWWTRYQPVSYKLISRSGSEQDFIDMLVECHKHGVAIIVDVVINHMANVQQAGEGLGGSRYKSKCSYDGLYSCRNFHHTQCPGSCGPCESCNNCEGVGCSGTDPSRVFDCNLGGLPDLDTSSPYVQQTLAGFLNHLVDLGVDGIRIDAAKHIRPSELNKILNLVKPPGLYVNQEAVLTGDSCICLDRKDYYLNGKLWEFNTVALLFDIFSKENNMDKIKDMDESNPGKWFCGWASSDHAHTFVTNHDRFINDYERPWTMTIFNEGQYSLALMTLLAHPYGMPNILSSINFDPHKPWNKLAPVLDPSNPRSLLKSPFDDNCGYWKDTPMKPYACEHRWAEVRNMVMWRKVAGTSATLLLEVFNQNVLAVTRGDWPFSGKALFMVNAGGYTFEAGVDTKGMPGGVYCNVVAQGPGHEDCFPCRASCPFQLTVRPDGRMVVRLRPHQALAFHVQSQLPGPVTA